MLRHKHLFFGIVLILLTGNILSIIYWNKIKPVTDTYLAQKITRKILEKILTLQESFPAFIEKQSIPSNDYLFFISNKGEIVTWNNHDIDPRLLPHNDLDTCMFIQNGLYYVKQKNISSKTFTALFLIHHQYPFENKYLKNQLNENIYENVQLKFFPDRQNTQNLFFIKHHNLQLPYIILENPIATNLKKGIICIFFILLVLLFHLIYIFYSYHEKPAVQNAGWLIYSFVWLLLQLLEFPWNYIRDEWFSPQIYAFNEWQQSPGQLLFNLIVFGYTTMYILTVFKTIVHFRNFQKMLLFVFFILIGIIINFEWHQFLFNNNISLRFDKFYLLDKYSIAAAFILLIPLLIWIISIRVISGIILNQFSNTLKYAFLAISILVLTAFAYVQNLWLSIIWPLHLAFIVILPGNKPLQGYFRSIFALLIPACLSLTIYLTRAINTSEQDKARLFAQKLADNRDPVAEFLFPDIATRIQQDPLIADSIHTFWLHPDFFKNYLEEKYFQGFWNKYRIRVTYCDENDSLVIQPDNRLTACIPYFHNTLFKGILKSNRLNYAYRSEGNVTYVSEITVIDKFSNKGKIFLEFYLKLNWQYEGFPELLIKDVPGISPPNIPGLSFAKYVNNHIEYSVGDYSFPVKPTQTIDTDHSSFHVLFERNEIVTIGVAYARLSTTDLLSLFSMFYFAGILFYLITGSFYGQILELPKIFSGGFGAKLQWSMIAILIIFTGMLIYFVNTSVKDQYFQRFFSQIKEKSGSIKTELMEKIEPNGNLTNLPDSYLDFFLSKLSNLFFVDIHIYTTDGFLYATSRNEVFRAGLTGPLMNPKALDAMKFEMKTDYLVKERLGQQDFFSYYTPLFNQKSEIIAWLNLPFFSKQKDLEKELNLYLSRFINIFMMMFILIAVASYFITGWLTRPLELLKNRIIKLQLSGSNELIDWKEKDEIGSLIEAYNNKVKELAKSVEELSRTERETAWREMAKQVAHEIKNPLTPMKLKLQLLQRSIDNHDPDVLERIKQTIPQLIEQIDTLAHIAGEFSTFAKMPNYRPSPICPYELLQNIIPLHQTAHVTISLNTDEASTQTFITGDKDYFVRMINNLIQNAIQAIPEDREGHIAIQLKNTGKHLVISVKDNGLGIPENIRDKIFQPNFTTKSAGMGLGLAMVRMIVENFGGNIIFTTEENKGTEFILTFPVKRDN